MKNKVLLSICIPTNGVVEWVVPVLDSIYMQGVAETRYEVIVTDNGENMLFHEEMISYMKMHSNLVYKKTKAYMFENQLEALKIAKGDYFKFLNHRAIMQEGALVKWIDLVEKYSDEKPVIYCSNGVLKDKESIYECSSFDGFISTLGRYVSWTTGVGIWKEHYQNIPETQEYDQISPHSMILFAERDREKYIIDNRVFSKEIEHDAKKKGTYDYFKAFAVEEIFIVLRLYLQGDITAKTFKRVKKDYQRHVIRAYSDFIIEKQSNSYNLDGFSDAMGIFMNKYFVILSAWVFEILRKVWKVIKPVINYVKKYGGK